MHAKKALILLGPGLVVSLALSQGIPAVASAAPAAARTTAVPAQGHGPGYSSGEDYGYQAGHRCQSIDIVVYPPYFPEEQKAEFRAGWLVGHLKGWEDNKCDERGHYQGNRDQPRIEDEDVISTWKLRGWPPGRGVDQDRPAAMPPVAPSPHEQPPVAEPPVGPSPHEHESQQPMDVDESFDTGWFDF